MVARAVVEDAEPGETTIPARKLYEIVRALPDGCRVTVSVSGDKATVSAGRSRFTLATLPANDFPSIDALEGVERVSLTEGLLKDLIERSAFAMAQQDVRYYLNGLLLDLRGDSLRCVATDGHRLARGHALRDVHEPVGAHPLELREAAPVALAHVPARDHDAVALFDEPALADCRERDVPEVLDVRGLRDPPRERRRTSPGSGSRGSRRSSRTRPSACGA